MNDLYYVVRTTKGRYLWNPKEMSKDISWSKDDSDPWGTIHKDLAEAVAIVAEEIHGERVEIVEMPFGKIVRQ